MAFRREKSKSCSLARSFSFSLSSCLSFPSLITPHPHTLFAFVFNYSILFFSPQFPLFNVIGWAQNAAEKKSCSLFFCNLSFDFEWYDLSCCAACEQFLKASYPGRLVIQQYYGRSLGICFLRLILFESGNYSIIS